MGQAGAVWQLHQQQQYTIPVWWVLRQVQPRHVQRPAADHGGSDLPALLDVVVRAVTLGWYARAAPRYQPLPVCRPLLLDRQMLVLHVTAVARQHQQLQLPLQNAAAAEAAGDQQHLMAAVVVCCCCQTAAMLCMKQPLPRHPPR